MQVEEDFPDLLPVKQVRMKRDLLGKRVYLSWTTGWHFVQALPESQTSFILTDFELIYFVSYRQLKAFFTMWSIGFLVWILCLTTFIYGNNIFSTCIYCIRHLFSESKLGWFKMHCIDKLALNVILNLQQTVAKTCLSWHDHFLIRGWNQHCAQWSENKIKPFQQMCGINNLLHLHIMWIWCLHLGG